MIRWTAMVVGIAVLVFSVTFAVARLTTGSAPKRPQLVAAPAPNDVLPVRSIGRAARLPGLRMAPGAPPPSAPASVGTASSPSPPASPSPAPLASVLRARAAAEAAAAAD